MLFRSTQTEWAVALAANRAGAAPLLDAVEQGLLSARILGLTSIRNRLQASKPPGWQERVAKLTRDIPTGDETRDRLIQERQQNFNPTLGARDTGQKVFQQHCAPCHQIEGQGSLVGPQLTGIGNRGVERLCEDILDPNRNVDVAFRQTLFTLKEGDVVSGLFRRDDGNSVVYTDAAGHDNSLPKAQVVQRREVDTSLMPENFNELISPADFNHLLAYLLAQRSQ